MVIGTEVNEGHQTGMFPFTRSCVSAVRVSPARPAARESGWQNDAMAMLGAIAQANEATNPILPSSNETLWGAVSVLAPMIVLIVFVVLAARYFQRLRRAAEDAATSAGEAARGCRYERGAAW